MTVKDFLKQHSSSNKTEFPPKTFFLAIGFDTDIVGEFTVILSNVTGIYDSLDNFTETLFTLNDGEIPFFSDLIRQFEIVGDIDEASPLFQWAFLSPQTAMPFLRFSPNSDDAEVGMLFPSVSQCRFNPDFTTRIVLKSFGKLSKYNLKEGVLLE